MSFTATQEQVADERQMDGVQAVGEALVRFEATVQAATRELRREVAAHYGGAAYIGEGSAARAIVRGQQRRAAR